ncbi:MAG: hypothetical protein WCW31_04825 [Patescibacteria group bacterium]
MKPVLQRINEQVAYENNFGPSFKQPPPTNSWVKRWPTLIMVCKMMNTLLLVLLAGWFLPKALVILAAATVASVALILAFGKDRRSQREGVHVQDGPMDFPTAMPPADSKPGEINYFVPAGDTSAALHSLVLMAHAPCSTLKGVVNAIVITRRRPNGIRYSMKSFRANDECMDILSLYVPESDALGCRYHAKLRQDLIHGAQRTLDVKLEYADGSVNELKNLSVYKSA